MLRITGLLGGECFTEENKSGIKIGGFSKALEAGALCGSQQAQKDRALMTACAVRQSYLTDIDLLDNIFDVAGVIVPVVEPLCQTKPKIYCVEIRVGSVVVEAGLRLVIIPFMGFKQSERRTRAVRQ